MLDPYATTAGRALLAGFEQTDEMRAADAAIAASTPETEPENWTHTNNYGWIYTGPLAQKNTATQKATYANSHMGGPSHDARRQWKTGRLGWMTGGDFLEQAAPGMGVGYGNISQESWDRHGAMGFQKGHPLIDVGTADHAAVLELYKQDHFNPYAHQSYAGGDKEIKSGSVADVLYNLTRDKNYDKRYKAYRATRNFQGDLAQTRMTNRFWNEYGLNEVFGDYDKFTNDPRSGPNPLLSGGGTSPVSGIAWQGSNMLSGDTSNVGEAPASTGKGFLGSYRNRKAELEASRPSVRSLFKEMEEYEEE